MPIFGSLAANETEKAEFVFNAKTDRGFSVIAVCTVEGGPEYEIPISGESSNILYKLEKRIIEFGLLPYQTTATKEVLIFDFFSFYFILMFFTIY